MKRLAANPTQIWLLRDLLVSLVLVFQGFLEVQLVAIALFGPSFREPSFCGKNSHSWASPAYSRASCHNIAFYTSSCINILNYKDIHL